MSTMTAQEINANKFLGKTATTPRPSHDPATDGPLGIGGQERLTRDRAQWDQARRWDADNAARRQAHLDSVAEKQAAERQARLDRDEARAVDELRRRYFSVDRTATEADFQKDLPEIKRSIRIQAAMQQPDERFAGAGIDPRLYTI